MSALDGLSLFEAADFAADLLRACDCGYDESDDVLLFRKLQRDKLPNLTDTQARDLFNEWSEHYYAKCLLDRQDAIARVTRLAEQHAKQNPPAPPFRCKCGETTRDPFNEEWMRIHQPHCAEPAKHG